jgi:hypothetical protein
MGMKSVADRLLGPIFYSGLSVAGFLHTRRFRGAGRAASAHRPVPGLSLQGQRATYRAIDSLSHNAEEQSQRTKAASVALAYVEHQVAGTQGT